MKIFAVGTFLGLIFSLGISSQTIIPPALEPLKKILTSLPEESVLKEFDFDRTQPFSPVVKILAPNTLEVYVNRDLICEEVSFTSPWGDRIKGYVFKLKDLQLPAPGVLALSGSPGKALAANSFAGQLARKGLIVMTMDALTSRVDGSKFNTPELGHQLILGQIKDFRRGLDYLRSRPEVDPQRMGVTGNSLGGIFGSGLLGLEPNIKAFLFQISMAGISLRDGMTNGEIPPEISSIDPLRLTQVPHTAPVLWQNQKSDQAIPKQFSTLSFELSGGPKEQRWYEGTHSTNPIMDAEGVSWLVEKLVK